MCACVSVDRVRHEDVVEQAGRGLQVPQGVRLRALIISTQLINIALDDKLIV